MYKVMVKNGRRIELLATTDDSRKAKAYALSSQADAAWIVDGNYRTIFSTNYGKVLR